MGRGVLLGCFRSAVPSPRPGFSVAFEGPIEKGVCMIRGERGDKVLR